MTIGARYVSVWTKSYSPRTIISIGAVLFALANVLASFSQALWQFMLTQGLLLGCRTCLAYIPAVTVAPGRFRKRRGFAMGIILSGTGIGGALSAPVLRVLNANIGFRNTLRLTGGLSFVLIAGSSWILKWHPEVESLYRLEASSGQSRFCPPLANGRSCGVVCSSRKPLVQSFRLLLITRLCTSSQRVRGLLGTALRQALTS